MRKQTKQYLSETFILSCVCHIIQLTKAIAAGTTEFRPVHTVNICLEMLKSQLFRSFLKKNCNAGGACLYKLQVH